MKTIRREITLLASHVDSQKIRFALFILTVTLLVIGAGAPDAGGGVIIRH